MKTAAWMGIALVSLALGSGCTPSPDKVCDHMFGLLEKELKGKDMPKSSDEDKKKSKDKCVADLEKEKEKDADGYKCGAKCIVAAASFEDVMKCEDTCPSMKKKKGGGGDDDKKKENDGDKKKNDKKDE